MAAVTSKICCKCGQNVAGLPRTKDIAGNYYCRACEEVAKNQVQVLDARVSHRRKFFIPTFATLIALGVMAWAVTIWWRWRPWPAAPSSTMALIPETITTQPSHSVLQDSRGSVIRPAHSETVVVQSDSWTPFQPQVDEDVAVNYDRFKNLTVVTTGGGREKWALPNSVGYSYASVDGMEIGYFASLTYIFRGASIIARPTDVALRITSKSTGSAEMFRFQHPDEKVYFLIDNNPLEVPIGACGPDNVILGLSVEQVLAVSKAASVELKIGVTEFRFTTTQLQLMRKFLSRIGIN